MSKDLELALRVKADLDGAKREIDGLNSSIADVSKTAADASQSAKDATKTVDDLGDAAEKTARTASGMGASFDQWNKIFVQTQRDLRAFEEANAGALRSMDDIAEQEARLDRLMSQGAISTKDYEEAIKKLDTAEAKLNKEHAVHDRELQKIIRSADKTAAELKKLTADAERLERALKAGKITQQDYEQAMAGIARRRADIDAASGALNRLGLNSREARNELLSLGRDLSRGNFSGAAADLFRISQRAEGGIPVFARYAAAIGATTAILGTFGYVSYQAWQDQRELDNTLSITGNTAGLTAYTFRELTGDIEANTLATVGQSREIISALARTGRASSDTLASFAQSIAAIQTLTKQSTDELVKTFQQLAEKPTETLLKLNESMNFLTTANYERVRSLEEAGDREAAALAASELLYQRHAQQAEENLSSIETFWINARKAMSDYWDTLKVVTQGNDAGDLIRTQYALGNRERMVERRGRDVDQDPEVLRLRARVTELQGRLDAEAAAAQAAADEQTRNNEAIAADRAIRAASERLDRQRQMQQALDKLQADYDKAIAAGLNKNDELGFYTPENLAKLQDDIRKRFADPATKTTTGNDQATRAAEAYVASMERQAAAIGKTAAEVRLLTSNEQTLNDEQRMRVNGILLELQWEEQRVQAIRDRQQLESMEIALLRAQGNEAEASAREMRSRYAGALSGMSEDAREEGQKLVDQLINLDALQIRLAEAEKLISQTLTRQQQQETSINTQREAGLITEAEARRRIVELHRETSAELEKQRPILEELASAPGAVGEAATLALAQLNQQAEQLNSTMNLFAATMNTAIEGGLTDAISNLAKGTQSFQDAIRSLAQTVIDAIIQINAQQIAQSITSSAGGWVSAIGSVMGYATGGYTGPGGKYQVAGIVHKGEGVLSQEDIAALGGPAGFYNLQASLRNGYADGGLAGIPAPALPSPTLGNSRIPEPAGAFNATLQNNMSFNLIDDPQRIADALNTPAGEEAITVFLSKNGAKVRSLIGVN